MFFVGSTDFPVDPSVVVNQDSVVKDGDAHRFFDFTFV